MKISIVTICFNSASTLEETIKSVISQSYNDIEYIIIDGASKDNTLLIIEQYRDNITRVISETDNGIYDAMNKAIQLATGDVIGILNSDDIYSDNEVLSDVMNHFVNDQDLDILYGNLVYVKNQDMNKIVRNWKSLSYYNNFFEHANVPPHPALFLRSKVYRKAGLFNAQYRFSADYEFMLRIFKKHNFKSKYINRLMVRMRLGGATNKSFKNVLNGNKEILRAWKENSLNPPITLMPKRIIKKVNTVH